MKIKTSEATNTQIDWLVAKCEGLEIYFDDGVVCLKGQPFDSNGHYWLPTQKWAQGGQIIKREHISLIAPHDDIDVWEAYHPTRVHDESYGPTPLIAAMRCYVASKLGDEVEIPEDLT